MERIIMCFICFCMVVFGCETATEISEDYFNQTGVKQMAIDLSLLRQTVHEDIERLEAIEADKIEGAWALTMQGELTYARKTIAMLLGEELGRTHYRGDTNDD